MADLSLIRQQIETARAQAQEAKLPAWRMVCRAVLKQTSASGSEASDSSSESSHEFQPESNRDSAKERQRARELHEREKDRLRELHEREAERRREKQSPTLIVELTESQDLTQVDRQAKFQRLLERKQREASERQQRKEEARRRKRQTHEMQLYEARRKLEQNNTHIYPPKSPPVVFASPQPSTRRPAESPASPMPMPPIPVSAPMTPIAPLPPLDDGFQGRPSRGGQPPASAGLWTDGDALPPHHPHSPPPPSQTQYPFQPTQPLQPPQQVLVAAPTIASSQQHYQLMKKAIANCLAGTVSTALREEALQALELHWSRSQQRVNFVLLFRNTTRLIFRALYVMEFSSDGQDCVVTRVTGDAKAGPSRIAADRVDTFYYYDSGSNDFRPLAVKMFTTRTHAVTLRAHLSSTSKR